MLLFVVSVVNKHAAAVFWSRTMTTMTMMATYAIAVVFNAHPAAQLFTTQSKKTMDFDNLSAAKDSQLSRIQLHVLSGRAKD